MVKSIVIRIFDIVKGKRVIKLITLLSSVFGITILSADEGKLRYVIDGDTVVFKTSKSDKLVCRLAYIDTPESKRNKKATRDVANCPDVSLDEIVESGRYAKRYVKSIMQKGKFYSFKVIDKDRYGRSVCIIGDLNDKIIKNGFGVVFWKYVKDPIIREKMGENQSFAKSSNKGLWRTHKDVVECMSK